MLLTNLMVDHKHELPSHSNDYYEVELFHIQLDTGQHHKQNYKTLMTDYSDMGKQKSKLKSPIKLWYTN